jgi:hypothetical protein
METMAQTKNSDLKIVTNQSDVLKKSRFGYSIYKGDTLKSITKIPNNNRFEKDHILPCGKYIIQIYKDDSIYHEFKEIELECGYKMVYTINLDAKTSYEMLEKSESDMFSIVKPFSQNYEYIYPNMNLGYGTRILENDSYPVQHLFRFGGGGFFNTPITRHFGFGYNTETLVEMTLPKKGFDLRPNQNYRHERYFYWNLKIGFYLRLSTFNMKQAHKDGMFLDIGGSYQLPIYFRHVGLYENHKDVTRSIHLFNDVSLSARIGSDKLSLYCQYRLFDYVKNPYPQTPILSFGICIRMKD